MIWKKNQLKKIIYSKSNKISRSKNFEHQKNFKANYFSEFKMFHSKSKMFKVENISKPRIFQSRKIFKAENFSKPRIFHSRKFQSQKISKSKKFQSKKKLKIKIKGKNWKLLIHINWRHYQCYWINLLPNLLLNLLHILLHNLLPNPKSEDFSGVCRRLQEKGSPDCSSSVVFCVYEFMLLECHKAPRFIAHPRHWVWGPRTVTPAPAQWCHKLSIVHFYSVICYILGIFCNFEQKSKTLKSKSCELFGKKWFKWFGP